MNLFGRERTRREIEARVGRIEQIAGVRRMMLTEGPEAGVEQIEVRTGAGLTYFVSPQRGLDIGRVDLGGAPISWSSPNGDVHPSYFDARGLEWLRTAAGGMLMTCGLRQVGGPGVDEGEELNLHGRAHHTPASEVSARAAWEDDQFVIRVEGTIRETRIFREHLALRRRITSWLGRNRIEIEDAVENRGFAPSPLLMLYHFNFGWPLLDERCEIKFPSRRVTPRDPGVPVEGYDRWAPPDPGYSERVYDHHDLESVDGFATASIHNPAFPICGGARPVTAKLSWKTDALPHMIQWKMAGAGEHVLGIEPANCRVEGRAVERQRGTLKLIQPGETVKFCVALELSVL